MSQVRRRSIFLSAVNAKSEHFLVDGDLFDATDTGADIPINSKKGSPFYNLQIRGKLLDSNEGMCACACACAMLYVWLVTSVTDGILSHFHLRFKVVLEDGTNDSIVALVERKNTTTGYIFYLYSKNPVYPGQERSAILKYNVDLFHYGQVTMSGGKLEVLKEGDAEVKYTLVPAGEGLVIERLGTKIATMTPSEGEFYNLDIIESTDPALLICLASIADEIKKKRSLYDFS
jgi:hypothetical protein